VNRTQKIRKRGIVPPGRIPVSHRPNKVIKPKKGPGSYKRKKRTNPGADESNSDAPFFNIDKKWPSA
jgi:hypothetical protein